MAVSESDSVGKVAEPVSELTGPVALVGTTTLADAFLAKGHAYFCTKSELWKLRLTGG